ncbi:MAG: DUF1353 domain-containing protein [Candidatus Peribacteraceae bacterium]|nr:DUF1353 domain-containing protein [Candidatus Peribacteraceae bacterium]
MISVIHCRTIQGKPKWRKLLEDYSYKDTTVPDGYEWNGSSTPWFAKGIIPKFELTLEASCIHDYLCEHAKTKADRKKADGIFKEMLREKGMGKFRSRLGYWGVRIGAFFNINGSKKSWE